MKALWFWTGWEDWLVRHLELEAGGLETWRREEMDCGLRARFDLCLGLGLDLHLSRLNRLHEAQI